MMNLKPRTFALLIMGGLVAFGCTSPDPDGRYGEFVKNTEEDRKVADAGTIEGGQQVDFSGRHFLSLLTPLNGGVPFFFQADVTVEDDFTFEIVLTPLKTDLLMGEARPDARSTVGEPIFGTGVLAEDGTFEVDLGDVVAPGEANPVTGAQIIAQIQLQGTVLGADQFCGTATGQVTEPLMSGIAGSTFGVVAIDEETDVTAIEPMAECPEGTIPMEDMGTPDGGGDGGMDGGMIDDSYYRCPDIDFSGQWTFEFKTSLQSERASLILDLTADADETRCFTGDVFASDGETDLGDVTRVVERDGQLIVRIPEFVIPPGANPALPNGGTSNITAVAAGYNDQGACGSFDTVVEPIGLALSGSWSLLSTTPDGYSYDADLANSGCPAIVPDTECAFTDAAGEYSLQFITETQQSQGGDPTQTVLTLDANPLTCLSGELESATTEGFILARVVSASDDGNGNLFLNGRNFQIPPGGNPLFPNGAWGDIPFTTTELDPGVSMCGAMSVVIFDPFDIASNGTFAAGTAGNEPTEPNCPM